MTKIVFLEYGMENYRRKFLETLRRLDFSITCIIQKKCDIPGLDSRIIKKFASEYESPRRPLLEFFQFPYFLKALREIKPDVIISGDFGARSLSSVFYALLFGTPVIIWARLTEWTERDRSRLQILMRRMILAKTSLVIVNGMSGLSYVNTLTKKPIRVIHQVSNINSNQIMRENKLIRRNSLKNYCYVGRLVPGKGLLELLTMLSHNNFEGNFNILGDGVLLAELSKFKYSKGMNVKFFGWCDDETISHFLDQADVMIFPSWSDEWGLAVVEAINMGTPVLGSIRSGAVEELVIEGFTGFRFDPEKEDSVMNAFRHFQYLDRRVHQTLKQNCFTFSREKNLTAENMAHQFNLAIQSVIK